MKKTPHRTNIQSSTHANQLHVLLKTEELGGHQLEVVTTTVIVEHMKLINNDYSKLSNGTVFDGHIDKGIRLLKLASP
jgi:hypothetical protein